MPISRKVPALILAFFTWLDVETLEPVWRRATLSLIFRPTAETIPWQQAVFIVGVFLRTIFAWIERGKPFCGRARLLIVGIRIWEVLSVQHARVVGRGVVLVSIKNRPVDALFAYDGGLVAGLVDES